MLVVVVVVFVVLLVMIRERPPLPVLLTVTFVIIAWLFTLVALWFRGGFPEEETPIATDDAGAVPVGSTFSDGGVAVAVAVSVVEVCGSPSFVVTRSGGGFSSSDMVSINYLLDFENRTERNGTSNNYFVKQKDRVS